MRIQFTILLLCLNVLAAAGLWYLERQSSADMSRVSSRGLLGPEVMEIDRLVIEGRDVSERRVLERNHDRWSMVAPIRWPANYYAVQRILSQLQFLEQEVSFDVEELVRSGQSLADYGLEDPALILTYTLGAETGSFKIGDGTRVGNRLYVLTPDEKRVMVVNRSLIDSVLLELEDLRSQQVFNIPVYEIRSLAIQTTEPLNQRIRLNREGDEWRFEAPLETAANTDLVDTTIGQITAMKVQRFISGDEAVPAVTGLSTPNLRLTLQGSSSRQTLSVGNRVATEEGGPVQYYAQLGDSDSVLVINEGPLQLLRNAHTELRNRRFVDFDPARVTAIDIEKEDERVSLQKLETGAWQVVEMDRDTSLQTHAADTRTVDRLLANLRRLEAVRFVTDSPERGGYGFTSPERTIRIRGSKDGTIRTVVIGDLLEGTPPRFYARTEHSPSVYEVSAAILQVAKLNPLEYRDRLLERQPASARVQMLKVTDLSDGRVLFERSIDPVSEGWEQALSDLPTEQVAAALQLIEQVKSFQVDRYLQDEYTTDFRLDAETPVPWRYQLDTEVFLPGGDQPRVEKQHYTFSERIGGRFQVGGSERHQMVFSLTQPLIDALFRLTFEESPPKPVSPDAVNAEG